jgi:hypothetical protein
MGSPEVGIPVHDIHANARTGLYTPPTAGDWMASNLAPVYLDDTRVTLQGDPRPQVVKILQAGGAATADGIVVLRLQEAAGAAGQPIGLDEVIDREKAIAPIHLRVVRPAGQPTKGQGTRGAGKTLTPGDITRGTEAISPTTRFPSPSAAAGVSGEQSARVGKSQAFAESQSFADPVHKGGIRTQETASEEGAKPLRDPKRTATTTTHRGTLEQASEEE